ncbi:uncharacterized protein [Anabrus simplex]|uniref:uncharacterized protein n=1 Tax=Anabrus simplex TaxID=316456 RepID=UPI0035A26ECD
MEVENNDVAGSVTTSDGLSALENTDSANGTAYLSNAHKMRSGNNLSDFDSVLKAVSNAVKSFDTSSVKYTLGSTTGDKNSIKETTTAADGDPINSSMMHDTTTEYVPECEEDIEGSCNEYVDDTTTTVMDQVFTSEKHLEDENHSTGGPTLTHTTTTSTYDTESTLLPEVTQTSDVENIDSTTLATEGITQGTISLISKKSSTTQRMTASSLSTGMPSPMQSPASSTAVPSTISATESSTENSVEESNDSTTELSYNYTSNKETKQTIASNSDYNENISDTFSDSTTIASVDTSTTNRDKANVSVCIGGRQVTSGDDCWLIQFQDSRSNSTVCPGALLTTNMVITSASCAIRLFNVGMEHIEVMHNDEISTSQRVRGIIVHENYRPDRSRPPRYDMGVIHLTPSQQHRQKTCVVCVAEPKMDVKVQRCRAAVRNSAKGENEAQRECKHVTPSGRRLGSVMTMCSKTSPPTPKVPSGSPLICNGMLAGVAFSWDRGQAFTPVNLFTTWIKNNQLHT